MSNWYTKLCSIIGTDSITTKDGKCIQYFTRKQLAEYECRFYVRSKRCRKNHVIPNIYDGNKEQHIAYVWNWMYTQFTHQTKKALAQYDAKKNIALDCYLEEYMFDIIYHPHHIYKHFHVDRLAHLMELFGMCKDMSKIHLLYYEWMAIPVQYCMQVLQKEYKEMSHEQIHEAQRLAVDICGISMKTYNHERLNSPRIKNLKRYIVSVREAFQKGKQQYQIHIL